MDFKSWIICEMPINQFQLIGKWNQGTQKPYHGYKKDDIGILTNPAGVEKIHKKWSNTQQTFDFYFLRSKEGNKHIEVGEVSPEWVKKELAIDIQPNEDNVTVIFTNNRGTERIPMTAWAIAHRMGHAIRRHSQSWKLFSNLINQDMMRILEDVYGYKVNRQYGYPDSNGEKALRGLAQAIGIMKSARDSNLVSFSEFLYELLAQYLMTGKIKYNKLPRIIGNSRNRLYSRVSNEDLEEWGNILQGDADNHAHYLDTTLSELEGKIFVM